MRPTRRTSSRWSGWLVAASVFVVLILQASSSAQFCPSWRDTSQCTDACSMDIVSQGCVSIPCGETYCYTTEIVVLEFSGGEYCWYPCGYIIDSYCHPGCV